jgi:hypothetical protein
MYNHRQITFEDSHIVYAGAALKMLSPKGRGGYIRNATWRGITADESGGLLWLQISNASSDPAENARVSEIRVEGITLSKLSCRFHTAAHPQSDCESVGVLDLDTNAPRVDMAMRDVKVLEGGEAGWACTGPAVRLVAPPAGVDPPLPPSCAAPLKSDDADATMAPLGPPLLPTLARARVAALMALDEALAQTVFGSMSQTPAPADPHRPAIHLVVAQ